MENSNQNLPDIIRDRKMLPYEVKKSIMTNIFFNCIVFMAMMIVTLIVNVSFNNLPIKSFDSYIDIIQIVCAIISIGVLETAYRKDSGTIGIYGIEFLIFSIAVLFVPYMYIAKTNLTFLRNTITGFAIYYLAKSGLHFWRIRHQYLKENMSDIKELVKEDKEGYLDEQSTKTLKLQKAEAEMRRKAKKKKSNGGN
ncbi:MAG: hypothetical protein IJ867_05160 [Clostridia bacterium]|nr:hypothetical protein [Clostridia bacterium]